MAPMILDGSALARRRAPDLRDRACAVAKARGTAPRLLLVAFEGPDGYAQWVSGKVRACEKAGVDVTTLIIPNDVGTRDARITFEDAVIAARADAVFVQIPFPPSIDGDLLSASIPPDSDIDLMSPHGFREFVGGRETRPPLTVAATLMLLEAHRVRPSEHTALVVGDMTPYNRMLRAALDRRGAQGVIVCSVSSELTAALAEATLVVTSVARPGAVRSGDFAPGAIVVDGGYFNPGGVGDIDLSDGIEHLKAMAPVPGGIGPMMVSALVEAVVSRAEGSVWLI